MPRGWRNRFRLGIATCVSSLGGEPQCEVAMELRILGPLEIAGENGPVDLRAAKHRRLLAALTLAGGRACSADALVDAVWGVSPPASARAVAGLRLPASQGTAEPRSARHDAERIRTPLRARVARRRPVRTSSGRRRRGDGARERLACALATRSRARALARAGVRRRDVRGLRPSRGGTARRAPARGSRRGSKPCHSSAGTTRCLVMRSRWHETIRCGSACGASRCWRSTGLAGRRGLDHYVELRRRLDDELGLEPSAELRQLQRRILEQDPELDASVHSATPRAHCPCRRTRWSDASAIWRRWPSSSRVATHDCSSSPAREGAARRASRSRPPGRRPRASPTAL